MTAFDRLKMLCDKQGISVNVLEERIGIGKNSLYSWKKKIPGGKNLQLVADYFDVSADYLLGREEKERVFLNGVDLEDALDNAMSYDGKPLTQHDRDAIRAYLEGRFSNK